MKCIKHLRKNVKNALKEIEKLLVCVFINLLRKFRKFFRPVNESVEKTRIV